jgi:NAD(P)-dependent dehydrogenase (short-subunit alcohol dehydrogenase family)
MDLGLQGRTAVVTAGGAGIGRAITEAFIGEGVRVVTADLDVSGIKNLEGVTAVELNLLDPLGPASLVETAAEAHGGIDILVNVLGAARDRSGGFTSLDDSEWHWAFEVNFMGMVRTTRAAIPYLQAAEKGGSIVSIASDAGRQADPFYMDYCAAKASVISLAKSLSLAYAPQVRSNVVSPGPTLTPGFVGFFEGGLAESWGMTVSEAIDHFAKNIRQIPMGRMGEPREVANVVLFLASELARQVTGSEYCVNGGIISAA